MTSIESIEGDPAVNFPMTMDFEETQEHDKPPIPLQGGSNTGLSRMREQEALAKASSPHLRELNHQLSFLERIERIQTLISEHLKYNFYQNSAYLICVKKLAPTHPDLAMKYLEKITDTKDQLLGYLHIAKHQDSQEALATLQAASKTFQSYDAQEIFSHIDTLFPNGDTSILQGFYRQIHHTLLNQRWKRSVEDLILLAELEIRMEFPNAHERVAQAHEMELKTRYQYPWTPEKQLRLLECEAKVSSPLAFDSLSVSRSIAENNGSEFLIKLLVIEAHSPFLSSAFEADFELAMESEEFSDKGLRHLVSAIAPVNINAAVKIQEKIEDGYQSLCSWIAIAEVHSKDPQFDREEALIFFKKTVDDCPGLGVKELVELFIGSAKTFGPDQTYYLMDRAIEHAQASLDDLLDQEIEDAGKVFGHYFGKALGIDISIPQKAQEPLSKFSYMDSWRIADITKGFATFTLPGTEELLERMYALLEEDELWGDDVQQMIRTELALGLNQLER